MTAFPSKTSTKGRTLYCRKCDGHGKLSVLKAHNTQCPYLFCECKNCQKLDKKRRNSFQKRNHRQIEAAQKLTKLRQHILQLRADLKDDPDAEVLIAELQKQKITSPSKDIVNENFSEKETFKESRRCQSCDVTNLATMTKQCELKSGHDDFVFSSKNQLVSNRAASSSPYNSPNKKYSADLNSTASSPSSKSSGISVAPFDLWLEKEFQRRQQKKMEAMRSYTATAQITTSSPIMITTTSSTPASTITIATNPLLSHALNTAGITKDNNQATTSTSLENLINRKRSAEDEIIQIDDDQPTPRRHCPNNDIQVSNGINKPLTTSTPIPPTINAPTTISKSSTVPVQSTLTTPTTPTETMLSQAVLESHRYVTLPTIPPISILVPNNTRIIDKLDEIIHPVPTNLNPSSVPLNGQPNSAIQEVSGGFMPSAKPIPTSNPNQLLLEGLRQQKPLDSESFSSAFLSQSLAQQSHLNPVSINTSTPQMFPQKLNNNMNNNNFIPNNNNFENNQLLNIVPPPQWIQLIQQPQLAAQKNNNLLQPQIQPPQPTFQQAFLQMHKNSQLQNQPFPPTITSQPQLRFPSLPPQPLPPTPTNPSGLSALLSQNNTPNIPKSINTNPQIQTSSTQSLPLPLPNASVAMQILCQPPQNAVESASNLSCNNLINFANFTVPILTSPHPSFTLQNEFENQKQQIQAETIQTEQMSAEQINKQQQSITSTTLLEHIQKQEKLATATSITNETIQLPTVSQPPSKTPSSQSHSPALSSIAKLNFSIEHQPFAQYLLNLPPVSPSGSISNTTPQLPSMRQSPSDVSTENGTSPSFTPCFTEQLFASTLSSKFDTSNLKPSSTDEIGSSFIEENDAIDKANISIGSNVNPTYLTQLHSTMIILSANGEEHMVK